MPNALFMFMRMVIGLWTLFGREKEKQTCFIAQIIHSYGEALELSAVTKGAPFCEPECLCANVPL